MPSILGKRKLQEAFGFGTHDKERYEQESEPDFFVNNVGHGVYSNPKGSQDRMTQGTAFSIPTTKYDEDEIIDWCYKYLASKKHRCKLILYFNELKKIDLYYSFFLVYYT